MHLQATLSLATNMSLSLPLGPVTYDIDMVAANSKFASKSDLSSSYNDAINLLANLGYKGADLAKIKADLTTSYKQLESYQSQLSASHQTIAHTGTVTGAGMFNGRSIYKGHLEVTIAEVPAPIRSRAAAQQYFKKIIDNFKPSGSNGQNGYCQNRQDRILRQPGHL
jgi:hypothetical protein